MDVSAGIVGRAKLDWVDGNSSGSATIERSGADLSLLLGWPAWHGRLQVGPLASIEMIWLGANSYGHLQHEIHFGAAAGLRTGYQYFWRKHFFARVDLTGCVAIVRHQFAPQRATDTPVFESPPAYVTAALGVGIWF
jgi:hypothetical protein